MRSLKVSGIIHLFAVLHAVVALSCHLASAGLTTMLSIPNAVRRSCIQNPQKPASYTE